MWENTAVSHDVCPCPGSSPCFCYLWLKLTRKIVSKGTTRCDYSRATLTLPGHGRCRREGGIHRYNSREPGCPPLANLCCLTTDTEGTFRPERCVNIDSNLPLQLTHSHRIAQIAERFGRTFPLSLHSTTLLQTSSGPRRRPRKHSLRPRPQQRGTISLPPLPYYRPHPNSQHPTAPTRTPQHARLQLRHKRLPPPDNRQHNGLLPRRLLRPRRASR